MAHLSFSLFGGFTVALDGQLVTAFGTNKARALLAYLAVEAARPHRRASLANMFWPESSQQKATHNLSQTLLRLRCALGENDVDSATYNGWRNLDTQKAENKVEYRSCENVTLPSSRLGSYRRF